MLLGKQSKVVLLAGSGSSLDLLPASILFNYPVVSLNFSFLYFIGNKNHVNFVGDYKKEDWFKGLDSHKILDRPKTVLSKYDFSLGEPFKITKNVKYLTASASSGLQGLDIIYKLLYPRIGKKIILCGIDFQGDYAKKIQKYKENKNYWDLPILQQAINKELEAFEKAIDHIKSEGIDVINLSPCSRLKQDLTIEDFING